MPPSVRKNTERSWSRSTPVTRLSSENTTPVPRPRTCRRAPPGAGTSRTARPWKKPRQPVRRVEEVERVARRRRVEHEQVEAALLVELVELRDRRELLRAGDRARELLVDAVGEHLVARARVGRQALDERVERALGVEHHRPQLALHLDAVGREARGVDEPRLVAELVEPERVGQPARRVDRHHRDPQAARGHAHRRAPPRSSSCPRRRSRRR